MEAYEKVKDKLEELNIDFEIVEHPPVLTTEEADSYIEGIDGVRTKSLFLTNKKKTVYYLLIMDGQKRLDMNKFGNITGTNHIKFCSTNGLMDKIGLFPGAVSIFGLLNNVEKDVQVYFDKEILLEDRMSFHPNDNTKTIFISTHDMLKFIESIGFKYEAIEL